jgi:hypothetical protein
MITPIQPLTEITTKAIHILTKEMGLANTIRFINQFTLGYGDYSEERKKLFSETSIDEITSEIKKTKNK